LGFYKRRHWQYRYKRKNLIPDDWFIRKSTFTGQETFFPREQIINRIRQIKDMKEDISLDDMAQVLTADLSREIVVDRKELLKKLSMPMAQLLEKYESDTFGYTQLIAIITTQQALKTGKVAISECEQILETILAFREPRKGDRLLAYRYNGVFFCIIASGEVFAMENTHMVIELNLTEQIPEIKDLLK